MSNTTITNPTTNQSYSTSLLLTVTAPTTRNRSQGTTPELLAAEEQQKWLFLLQIVCLSIISLVGTVANTSICYLVFRAKRKSSDYFILNLATTDLLVCAVGIPLDIFEQHQHEGAWPYGNVACHVIYPSQTLLVLVSIMTLTAMSLERYRAIITPLKHKLSRKAIAFSIFMIWAIGLGIIVPYSKVLSYDGVWCSEKWPGTSDGNYYTLALFILDYCIPLTIIAYCYGRAGYQLHKSCAEFHHNGNNNNNNTSNGTVYKKQHSAMQKRLESNKKVIKTFSFAVLVFLVCMLPGDVYWMWLSFGDGSSFAYDVPFRTFTNIMLYSNSAINPFIFGAVRRRRRSSHSLLSRATTTTTLPKYQRNTSKSTLRSPTEYEPNAAEVCREDTSLRTSLQIREFYSDRETDL